MPVSSAAWKTVRTGLRLKLVAMWILLAAPLVAATLAARKSPAMWPVAAVVGLAALTDFAGRCLCLAAPVAERRTLIASVICQAFGLIVLIAFGGFVDTIGLWIGLAGAFCLQVAAAYLFTSFLDSTARSLGLNEARERVELLRGRLTRSLVVNTGVVAIAFLLAISVLVVTVVTWGAGLLFALPAAVILIPFALLALGSLAVMYSSYSASLSALRDGIAASETELDGT